VSRDEYAGAVFFIVIWVPFFLHYLFTGDLVESHGGGLIGKKRKFGSRRWWLGVGVYVFMLGYMLNYNHSEVLRHNDRSHQSK